jgi:hypothetical protein
MIMATYEFASLLNTADGMTQVNDSTVQSKTLEVEGATWYHYAGNTVNKLYINGKGYIGFGADVEHLKMFCATSAMDIQRVYRQEGTLSTGTKFLKLRIYGEYYISMNNSCLYEYEVFLFDDGNIFVYIIKSAKDDYNLYGKCEITDGKTTKSVLRKYDSDFESSPISRLISNAGIKLTVSTTKYTPIKEAGARVKTNPSTVYLPNKLDWSELAVESYDASGNTNVVSNFAFPDVDVSTAGTKTVNLSYKTYNLPVEITVKEDKVLELTNISLRDHYLLNETLEVYSVTATWESGKNETLTSGFDVSGFDSATPGAKELTISYKGVTVTKSIYIAATATLTVDNVKTEYYIGDEFGNVSGIITYDNGKEERVYNLECSGFDNTLVGEQIITATVRGLSTTYTVNVSDTVSANIGSNVETDVTVSLNLITGLLTISGTGDTKSINAPSYWNGGILNDQGKYSSKVKEIVVQEGITGLIGACFYGMSNVTEVSLPSTLKTIGSGCFNGCSRITTLVLPEGLKVLQSNCFLNCEKLTELTLPESLTTVEASIINNSNMVLTVLSRTVQFDNYAINAAKTIRGYIGSTAETYANSKNIPFEIIDKILKIEIVNRPSKTYHIGETISKADLTVKIIFEDGTERETNLYELSYDFSSTGTKTVTVFIGDKSATFNVDVTAYKFSELVNTSTGMQPIRNNSKQDEGTDALDGVNWFKFNNVTVTKLYINGNNWVGFGTSTAQLKVCNRDGAIWNIYRLETTLGDGTKLLKIRVEGYTYYNGSGTHKSQIKYELFLFSNGDMYMNVIQSPVSTSTYAGTSSLISNGKTTNLSLNGATPENPIQVTFVHQDNAGLDWNVVYKAYSFTALVGIKVVKLPDKTRYMINEVFESSGLIIDAVYDDGSSEAVENYTLSPPDMASYGNKSITVTYESFTTTFDILVVDISGIEVKTMPAKIEYPKGDVFDTTGLSILVKYTDGTSETKTTGFEVSGFDSSSVGEKTITVTYKTHTATFKVTVYDLSGIRITSFPSKVYYKIGEIFDPSGLTVAEVRQDGTEKEITDYEISGFDSSTAGSKTITVSYNTITNGVSKFVGSDSFQIKVTNDGNNPFDGSSGGGSGGGSGDVEEEKTEPIKVTVHWINGEFADLTNENIDQNTLTLQESICSESYFIFGGCVCNQITFQAHHDQFNGTSEEFYPSGKIEVYIERKGTKIKIFTGEIDSAERKANSLTRNFIAYDYLYKLRNTDIARWYKNQTTDKKKKLTQKQFRDKLFEFLGLEQVSTKLHWDDTYVPDTNNSNEMNVVNILKDLCLQNDRFGWMNRDGKFEYLKLRQNSYRYGQTTSNQNIYKYYNNEEVHLDTFKSFTAKEGRIWFPNIIFCDPDPNRAFGFTQGDYTAQEAYDNNVYYNRNSFFVGNEDWLNYVWDADEYGGISRAKPIMKICYGVFVDQDLRKYYRAQGYTAEVQGNPFNMVGQAVELYYKKQIQHDDQEPTELQWYVHSYIMSRTLKIGATDMIDTYSANNAPFNSNSRQLGKDTPEISATVNRTRSEMPTISYAEFTDGSDSEFSPAMIDDFTDGSGGSGSTSEQLKKAQLRCVKRIKKADYDALVAAGTDRADTLYFTFEEK